MDIGCGRQWYRKDLEPKVNKYYALDNPKTARNYQSFYPIELQVDATKIPLPTGYIDFAMMLMVLEHLPDPESALLEVRRVLRKNGELVISTVENYPGHDLPYNYYHWTKYGLAKILSRNGFRVKKMLSFGNYWETQAVFRNVYLMQLVKRLIESPSTFILGLFCLVGFYPIIVLGNLVALFGGGQRRTEEYALAHLVIAVPKISK